MKQERLFDINSIEIDPSYISPTEKKKWTIAFRKWCNEQYDEYGSLHGVFCCGCMRICDLCEQKINNACDDCVEAIKTYYKERKKEIPYRNYNFKEILKEVENGGFYS